MITASRVILTSAFLFSFLLGATVTRAGYVICIEPDGSVNIEDSSHHHCAASSHQEESPNLHGEHDHSPDHKCGSEGQHESHDESSSKFIDDCFVHCLDVPINVQNAPTPSSPELEAVAYLATKIQIALAQKPRHMLIEPLNLPTFKLEKSQKLNIIRTVVLTV